MHPTLVPLLLLLALAGCRRTDPRRPVEVFAAASLGEAFADLATAFEARHPDLRVDLHCAGSETLVQQLLAGARADLLCSADQESLEPLLRAGLAAGEPEVFARNRLVLAVPSGNPHGVRGVADLARSDLVVALCGPGVPAGRYARELCNAAGVQPRSVSDEPSVTALAQKLRLGELDLAVVYATDVRASAGALEAVELAEELGVRPSYPLVLLAGGAEAGGARDLRAFLDSPEGRAILTEHGFLAP